MKKTNFWSVSLVMLILIYLPFLQNNTEPPNTTSGNIILNCENGQDVLLIALSQTENQLEATGMGTRPTGEWDFEIGSFVMEPNEELRYVINVPSGYMLDNITWGSMRDMYRISAGCIPDGP